MSEICNRRKKCTNERYKESTKCILHCDKLDFNDEDVRLFWQILREKYVQYSILRISNEINIEGVIFPRFEVYRARENNFFQQYHHFTNNVKFINCTFIHDFDLTHSTSRQKIIFEDCTFNENILLNESNKVEILDSTFKNETSFGNQHWKIIELINTKFFKKVYIEAYNILDIDNCVFNDGLSVIGFGNLDFNLQSGKSKRELSIKSTKNSTLKNVELKSKVNFLESNHVISIEDITFEKDVSFNAFHNLSISNSIFNQKSDFLPNKYNDIVIQNSTVNNITLNSANSLKIIADTKIVGSLQLEEQFQNLTIQNSRISEELNIGGVRDVILENTIIEADSHFSQEYVNVLIKKSKFKNLKIKESNILDVYEVEIVGDFDIVGKEKIKIDICDISNTLQIGKVSKLELNNIKSEPTLKLKDDEYEDINIKNSAFFDIEMKTVKVLNFYDINVNGKLSLLGETNGDMIFEVVTLKNMCSFPKMNSLTLKNSEIHEKIIIKDINDILFFQTEFKNEIIFLEKYSSIIFEKCQFYKNIKLSNVNKFIQIKSSLFKGEIDFRKGNFEIIDITSGVFEENLLISSSIVNKLNIDVSMEDDPRQNIFKSIVDFTNSLVKNIKVTDCDFQNELKFINNQEQLTLSDISNSKIKDLVVIENFVVNLFQNSKNLNIDNFVLEHSKLDTTSQSEEIDINNITINTYKWNKIILLKVINFYEMDINKFTIENSNIEQRFRIKESNLGIFILEASTFEDLQIIDNKSNGIELGKKIFMTNTTIKNAVLDKLKYNNFMMKDAHVSEAKIGNVEFKNGTRETNRFFKNYYDSIRDYIKADSYYQQEMDEHYKESKQFSSRWWILDFGKAVSNFGECWLKPLIWALLFTLVLYRVANYELLSLDGFRENHISWMINDVLKFLNPFSKTSTHDYANFYWAWLIHKILLTIFTYHFLVAIKRKTKR